jgi:hypothetical protein
MSADLVRVDPRYPGAWDALWPYLDDALKQGGGDKDWSVLQIYDGVVSGRLALWALVKDNSVIGSGVTCITQYPRRQVMEVLAMGADEGSGWEECLDELKQHARAMGLSAIIGTGRPGWARKLGAMERRVFELDLTESQT